MNDEEIVESIARAIDRVRAEEPPLDFNIVHERSSEFMTRARN